MWYKKLTKEQHKKLRRTNYRMLRNNGASVKVAVKVRNWRKHYVKQYIKNVIQ